MSVSVSGEQYTFQLKPASAVPAGGKIVIVFLENGEMHGSRTRIEIDDDGNDSLVKKAGTSADIGSLGWSSSQVFTATASNQISAGAEINIVATGFIDPPTGRYSALFYTTDSSDNVIDGDGWEDDSVYRAYYTIGTPVAYGRVLDPDGDPVSGAWVDADTNDTNTGEYLWSGCNTDELGYFSIGTLEEDSVTVQNGALLNFMAHAPADTSWGTSERVTKTYSTGSTINVEDDLQFTVPTKTISGTVKYPNGNPVTNARVEMFSATGWKEVEVNSSGRYTATIKGGTWDVMPRNNHISDPDWAYGMPPRSASFKKNESTESRTLDFTVQRANSHIKGKVILPNGSPPSNPANFHVGAFSMTGGGGDAQLNNDGTFDVKVPSGSYQLEINDHDQNYAQPDMDSVTVGEDKTVNIGAVQLIARDAKITGKIVDENGNSLPSAEVFANKMRGMGWAMENSNNSGNFTLDVFPGKWMLNVGVLVQGDHNYVLQSTIPEVSISSGETKSVGNIVMVDTNATISGNIIDGNGNTVSDIQGFVFVDRANEEAFMGPGMGGVVDSGRYTVNVAPGTYTIGIGVMPGMGYSSAGTAEITIGKDEELTHNITVYENDLTITGTIKDEDGDLVKNTFMEIFATGGLGAWQNAFLNQDTGRYTLEVASQIDPWSMGYFIDPTNGYFSQNLTDNKISGNAGETITKNIVVRKADATISGQVLDGDGQPMEDVFVFADNRGMNTERKQAEFMGPMFMHDNLTDSNGEFTIEIPHGTYKVGASLPPESRPDLINPRRVEVEVGSNETVSGIELAFLNADAEIFGKVELDGEKEANAFIWAWSDEGGHTQTESDENGDYVLNVTENDTWHLGVNNDVDESEDYVKSEEQVVSTENNSEVSLDLELETQENGLITPVSTNFTASNSQVSNLSNGSQVTVPANAMGTSGTVTLNASSTSEIARTTSLKPLTTGLELTAKNSSGSSITSFNSDVMVEMPYNEDTVEGSLVTEDDLVVAYWDENNGVWQPMENYSVDKENNKITFSTGHFTTFAIVSDTVGGEISASEGSTDSSSTDDNNLIVGARPKIYDWKAERYYTATEDPEERVKLLLKGLHMHDDTMVTIGYKEAESVSAYSGGKRLIAKFDWDDLDKKYDPMRYIRVTNADGGSRKVYDEFNLNNIPLRVPDGPINSETAEGISNLQLILKNNGFYHHPEITGYFGSITQQALREFQSHHGLGITGTVDETTRQKLLEFRPNI